jgi:rhodanese-related sulfurtransferase
MDQNTLISIAIAVAVFFAFKFLMGMGVPKIAGAAAKKLVSEGALLVDVRSPAEFAGGAAKGAKNIPVSDVQARLKDFGAKDRPVIVCCASGTRSAMAGRALKKAGFTQVFNLGPWQNYNR